MRIDVFADGYAVCGDSSTEAVVDSVQRLVGQVSLIVADPPYGGVLKDAWDNEIEVEGAFVDWMLCWTKMWAGMLLPDAAFYVWGGIGRPGFRPFLRYLPQVEAREFGAGLLMANLVTWAKRRAYGVKWNYLFTREELAYFIKGDDIKRPRCFNIPLLETKRGYAGYNAKYPAKSEFYRRTNVWSDVTEVMQGKLHPAQKAQRVIEIPIEIHTQPGEWVIDPFAGSGTTAFAARKLGRKFVVIEKDEKTFDEMVTRLRVNEPNKRVVSEHDQDVTHQARLEEPGTH